MANWKIQDIAPPKKLKGKEGGTVLSKEPEKGGLKNRRGQPRWFIGGILPLFVLAVISIGAVHFFFAKAEVLVWPATRTIKLLEPIVAEVERSQANLQERIIPARTLTTEKTATRLFDASSRTIKEDRATGTIRVFNGYTTSPQTLIAQTRFVSEEGKLFRTPVKIPIPGATQQGGKLVPGFFDVQVVAAEPGEDYNIGPSNFSLPGLSGFESYTAIYGESSEPMTGGSEREVPVVSEEDIAKAKESLIKELTASAAQELLAQAPEQMATSKELVSIRVTEADSLVDAGAEVAKFNVRISLIATAFLLAQADLNTLRDGFLREELQEGERIAAEKTQTSFQEIAVNQDKNTVAFKLGIETVAYQYVDPTELKIKLRGKSKKEAVGILASYDSLEKTDLSLWPFWFSFVPEDVDRIRVRTVVD